MTAQQLPDAVLQAFRDATEVVMERESANDAQFTKVYPAMKEFQADVQPWHELGYLPRDWTWDNESSQ